MLEVTLIAICNAITALANLQTELIKANPQAAADSLGRIDAMFADLHAHLHKGAPLPTIPPTTGAPTP